MRARPTIVQNVIYYMHCKIIAGDRGNRRSGRTTEKDLKFSPLTYYSIGINFEIQILRLLETLTFQGEGRENKRYQSNW